MISFIICLALLIGGYFVYGKVVENTFSPDDRETPAVRINDGVDYVVMPKWKLFLVQLLNIAGLGPIFGALQGALWGPIVFLWITFGTIFAGGVHDYFSGMLSERNEGASISEVCGIYLGNTMKNVMRVFSVVLLVMVGTVFAVGPAGLIVTLLGNSGVKGIMTNAEVWLWIILAYYFIATFLSIDKIIGLMSSALRYMLDCHGAWSYLWHIYQCRLYNSGDLEQLYQYASGRKADLELYVHHRCLWCDFRIPFDTVAADGTLHEIRETGTFRILRGYGCRGRNCTDLGSCRMCTV